MTAEKQNMNPNHHDPADQSWFERPKNIKLLIWVLIVVCALLVLADLVYPNPHPHFGVEKFFGFQAWFGFAAFVGVVFLGRFLRLIVKREEDYYD